MRRPPAPSSLSLKEGRSENRSVCRPAPQQVLARRDVKSTTLGDRTGAGAALDSNGRIAGNFEDAKVAALERTGATARALAIAVAWASGLTDVAGPERRPPAGVVAEAYDILRRPDRRRGLRRRRRWWHC